MSQTHPRTAVLDVFGGDGFGVRECSRAKEPAVVKTERLIRLAVSAVTAAVLSGGSAWALTGGFGSHPAGTATTVPCKPGFGYGDHNHCHSGPPGQATTTSSSTTSTSSTSSTSTSSTSTSSTMSTTSTTSTTVPCKPGCGYGDTNHCHFGPPGLLNKTQHGHQHP